MSNSAAGQIPALPTQPLLGSTLSVDFLEALPTNGNPFAIPETIQPETIGDGFTAGGLNLAKALKFGAFLNSWTQTQYRVGNISIADPRQGGTPLLLPILPLWDQVTLVAGAMGVDENASGLSMRLEPRRPATTWFRSIEGALSGGPLVSDGTSLDSAGAQRAGHAVPIVDLVRRVGDGSVLVSGPMTDRLGVVAAASWRGLSHVPAPGTSALSDRVTSGFAHLVFAATPRDDLRAIGWTQRVTSADSTETGIHVQSTWERRDAALGAWQVFGGYTGRSRTAPVKSVLLVDSFVSDPVSDLIDMGAGFAGRWVLGARLDPPSTRRLPSVGVEIEGARVRVDPTGIEQIHELVDGAPARLWTFHAGVGRDVRRLATATVYANEHVTSGPLTLDAGLRFDAVTAAADAAAHEVHWTTWMPRAIVRWNVTDTAGLSLVAGYRRSAYTLPLSVLAVGNPAAPVADVAAWDGAAAGPLIARVGPGTGGDATLTQIDPDLRRPITDELVLAIESRPIPGLLVQLARITKREDPLFAFVNTGVASSEYTAFQVPDVNFLPDSPVGQPQVTVLNRPPGLYGRDRYLLTNRDDAAKSWGIELTVRASTDRFVLLAGSTLTWARGPAGAVGFLPTQNDQHALGNMFVDPNAGTAAHGQLFVDRSHVIKMAGIYQFPWRLSLGAIARYQDGQPFARLVVVPNVSQGPTVVRSFTNGGSAFTYTGTLDIRVQKILTTGRAQVTAMVDVYNVPNLGKEVAEYVASGESYRTPTALQPPRMALVGLRVTF